MFILASILSLLATCPIQDPDTNWLTYNGDLAGRRYSPLKQITRANVGKLREVARFETGQDASFQTGPVVVNGTMFVTTFSHTYAINAVTGKLKWKDVADVKKQGIANNRGVAYDDGRVFRGYGNGDIVAFDAATGNRIWTKKVGHPELGESMPIAPIAWQGHVFIGNAGGDNKGVTGHIYALDEKTGEQAWKFDTVPTSGPAADTWKNKNLPPAGGATWSTYSIDTSTGVLYASVGNPAPDFDLSLRPGDSLYTDCVIAIDANTGKLLAYVQPTKHDQHDWDIAAAPVVIKTNAGRSFIAAGGKDGMLYGIDNRKVVGGDASLMSILYSTPVTRRLNVDAPLNSKVSTRFAPGSQGGMEWNGPCYDPDSNLIFTPATDWPVSVKLAPKAKIIATKDGEVWSGASDDSFGTKDKQWGGYLTAVDADSGKVRWKYKSASPIIAGVTATAGGVVFSAEVTGEFRAFDSATGRILWHHHLGRSCGGGIVSYSVDGQQYIAVAAGAISFLWPTKPATAEIVIYRL